MGEEVAVNFSAFESKLSAGAFACFRILLGDARERISQDGPQKIYETPLNGVLEASGAGDVEAVAQSIRDIIECRVEMKKGGCLYFFPFFASVAIERGIIKFTLPTELESVLPSVTMSCSA